MISLLLTGLFLLIFITAALAPIEALGWYAGWFGEETPPEDAPEIPADTDLLPDEARPSHYLVFLSGIGAISGSSIPPEEIIFLDSLGTRLPGTFLVRDVFPYSVTNLGLTGQRFFAKIWRRVEKMRLQNQASLLAMLVNIRNLFQVLVSADRRYGPIYNLGVAQEIYRALIRHGYRPGEEIPVTLLGWSGGGQISVGAVTYLSKMIDAPLRIISVGGVISDDPGLIVVTHLYHLYGEKDPIQAVGGVIFPGRWPISKLSYWNRAQANDKITRISMGQFKHNGKNSYFDMKERLPDGRTYMEKVVDELCKTVEGAGLVEPSVGHEPA